MTPKVWVNVVQVGLKGLPPAWWNHKPECREGIGGKAGVVERRRQLPPQWRVEATIEMDVKHHLERAFRSCRDICNRGQPSSTFPDQARATNGVLRRTLQTGSPGRSRRVRIRGAPGNSHVEVAEQDIGAQGNCSMASQHLAR